MQAYPQRPGRNQIPLLPEVVRREYEPILHCHSPRLTQSSPLTLPPPTPLPVRASQCAECHAEVSDHELTKVVEMAFACKKCRRTFRKDMTTFDEADEYCKSRLPSHFSLRRVALAAICLADSLVPVQQAHTATTTL